MEIHNAYNHYLPDTGNAVNYDISDTFNIFNFKNKGNLNVGTKSFDGQLFNDTSTVDIFAQYFKAVYCTYSIIQHSDMLGPSFHIASFTMDEV